MYLSMSYATHAGNNIENFEQEEKTVKNIYLHVL